MKEDEYGLLPPAYPYDNEMIMGHYTSNNMWTLLGLRYAIRLAEDIGETETANEWRKVENEYSFNILKGIDVSAKENGYVPTGLYPFITGDAARKGFPEYSTTTIGKTCSCLIRQRYCLLLIPGSKVHSTI